MGAVWVANFGVAYFLLYRSLNDSRFLTSYRQGYFFRPDVYGLVSAFIEVMTYISGFWQAGLLVLVIGGLVVGLRKTPRLTSALLLSPILFTLIAASLQMYPFAGRLILFLLPGVLILVAAGIREILDAAWQAGRNTGAVAAIVLLVILGVVLNGHAAAFPLAALVIALLLPVVLVVIVGPAQLKTTWEAN